MKRSALVFVLTTFALTRLRHSARQWRIQAPETTKISEMSAGDGENKGGERGAGVVSDARGADTSGTGICRAVSGVSDISDTR